MKLFITLTIFFKFLFTFTISIHFRKSDDTFITKLSDSLYEKIQNQSNLITFLNNLKNSTIFKRKKDSKRNFFKKNITLIENDYLEIISEELECTNRTIEIIVKESDSCTIFFNDTLTYNKSSLNNFIDLKLIKTKPETIIPEAVYSNEINITLFNFNKRNNIFSVILDKNNKTNVDVQYFYKAINLIKSTKSSNGKNSFNYFNWSIKNNNLNNKMNLTVVFLFNFNEIALDDIKFNVNVTKSSTEINGIVYKKYVFNEQMKNDEEITFTPVLPLNLERCEWLKIHKGMLILGSMFIVVILVLLYYLFSVLYKEF